MKEYLDITDKFAKPVWQVS